MDMKDMPMQGMEKKGSQDSVHKASGVVTRVDKDKALLEKLAKVKKVDFEFVQEGRDHVVTAVK